MRQGAQVGKGLLAGVGATVVLSVMMVIKAKMGVMPGLDISKMLAGMLGAAGSPLLGRLAHVLIGVVGYGVAIALIGYRLGNSPTVGGIVIAIVGWLIMMVMLMPLAGAGLFGMAMGPMAAIMTLVLHLIFGAVLGWTYGRLTAPATAVARTSPARNR